MELGLSNYTSAIFGDNGRFKINGDKYNLLVKYCCCGGGRIFNAYAFAISKINLRSFEIETETPRLLRPDFAISSRSFLMRLLISWAEASSFSNPASCARHWHLDRTIYSRFNYSRFRFKCERNDAGLQVLHSLTRLRCRCCCTAILEDQLLGLNGEWEALEMNWGSFVLRRAPVSIATNTSLTMARVATSWASNPTKRFHNLI